MKLSSRARRCLNNLDEREKAKMKALITGNNDVNEAAHKLQMAKEHMKDFIYDNLKLCESLGLVTLTLNLNELDKVDEEINIL